MPTTAENIAARLQAQRNPNLQTDRGLNSVSPYFLVSGQTFSTIQQGWSDTGANVDAYAAQGRAKVKAANDLAAAQAAAEAARKAQAASEAQAQAASAAQAKQYAQQQKDAASQFNSLQGQLKDARAAAVAAARSQAARSQAAARKQVPKTVGGAASAGARGGASAAVKATGGRAKALALANTYVGKTPYVFGGVSHGGIDCSGLIMAVYSQLGYKIPMHSATWQGRNIPGVRVPWGSSAAKPGDIVAWKDGSHIAIYAGNGQIIEAAHPGTRVRYHSLWTSGSNVTVIHLNI